MPLDFLASPQSFPQFLANASMPISSQLLIDVRSAGTKGIGVFAKAPIPKGTCILTERPLVTLSPFYTVRHIVDQFDALPSALQREFWSLAATPTPRIKRDATAQLHRDWNAIPQRVRHIFTVFETNAWGDSLFMAGSRFNHSCRPNVRHGVNSQRQEITFSTLRDIEAGEELCVTYLLDEALILSKDDRQAMLERWFDRCLCPECEDSEETPGARGLRLL